MISYGDMSTANVESSRTNLRKIARHEESEFSNASILNSMEKFVRTVSEMEETILVPSRLLDLSVGDANDVICQKGTKHGGTIKDVMPNTDLYRLYNIVNRTKLELLWSQKSSEDEDEERRDMNDENEERVAVVVVAANGGGGGSGTTTMMMPENRRSKALLRGGAATENARLGHARCPSTTSMQSVQSAASTISSSSDSDSDMGIENDSGLEIEETTSDRMANLAAENFRRHLRGLHRSIKRMTQAAEYLTLRYQADVGGPA